MKRPIAIDLFAGCGGMSLGLEAAGFDIAAAVEFDAVHAMVHHFNFPYTKTICKDISKLTSDELIQAVRDNGFSDDIDLIAGGPPCQGFSQMGKRQLDDPRNSLVFEYLRMIRDIKPKYFIFENVPGIAAGNHKKFLDELIVEFESLGYRLAKPIQILDASLYGAPQKRKRLILLGSREDVTAVTYPDQTHSNLGLLPLTTVGQAISDISKIPAYVGEDLGIHSELMDYSDFRKNYSFIPNGCFKLCHTRTVDKIVYNHIGSKHTEKSIEKFHATPPGSTEKTSRFFKLSSDGLCNTLRAGTASDKGAYTAARPIHYESPRCITVREAARLHSFPDWFQFHTTIWHSFREIGNAVIPMFSKAIADQIINALQIDPIKLKVNTLDKIDRSYLSYNMSQASSFWDVPHDVIAKRKRLGKVEA